MRSALTEQIMALRAAEKEAAEKGTVEKDTAEKEDGVKEIKDFGQSQNAKRDTPAHTKPEKDAKDGADKQKEAKHTKQTTSNKQS